MLTLPTPAPFLPKTTQTIRLFTSPTPRGVPAALREKLELLWACAIGADAVPAKSVRQGGARSGSVGGFSGRHTAGFERLFREFAPALLRAPPFDVRREFIRHPQRALVNLGASYKFNRNWSLVGEVLNVFNRRDHDVDYAYVSQITPAAGLGLPATPPTTLAGQEQVANAIDANAAFTRVMHPVEPVQARFTLRYSFGSLKQKRRRFLTCANG